MLPMHSEEKETPRNERERSSRRLCIVGLVFCWLIGIAPLAVGVYLVHAADVDLNTERVRVRGYKLVYPGGLAANFNKFARELAPLGLNIVVTICNDITGYIYTV